MRRVLIIGLSVTVSAWALQETPQGTADPRVDEVLTRLQNRSDGLKDIRCDVTFVEDDRINLTKRKKSGRILFS